MYGGSGGGGVGGGGGGGFDWSSAVTAFTQLASLGIQYDAAQDAQELQKQRMKQQKKLRKKREKQIEKQKARMERQQREDEDNLTRRSLALRQNSGGRQSLLSGPETGQENEDTLG